MSELTVQLLRNQTFHGNNSMYAVVPASRGDFVLLPRGGRPSPCLITARRRSSSRLYVLVAEAAQ